MVAALVVAEAARSALDEAVIQRPQNLFKVWRWVLAPDGAAAAVAIDEANVDAVDVVRLDAVDCSCPRPTDII